MTTTVVPASVALPPDGTAAPGAPLVTATAAYSALVAADPKLLPPEAVRAAELSHRFAAMRPQPSRSKTEAVAAWRQGVREVVTGDGEPVLPSLQPVADSIALEEAARELTGYLFSEWRSAVAGLGHVLAAHGDQLVANLGKLHDEAWSTFLEHEYPLRRFRSESAVLHGGAEASQHFTAAGNALATFGRCRHARTALNRLPAYSVAGAPDDLLLYRKPAAVAQVRLPGDTLPRWRAIAEHYPAAEPALLSRAEAQAATDQALAAARRRRIRTPVTDGRRRGVA